MFFIFSIILAAILFYKLPHLINMKMWKDLIAFSVLFVIGSFISFALIFRMNIPNPTDLIVKVFGFMK